MRLSLYKGLTFPLNVLSAGRRVAAHPVDQDSVEAVGERIRIGPRLQPRIGPVGRRQEEESSRVLVEVGTKFALLATLAEELSDALLVAPSLGDDLLAAPAFEVLPLLDE